MDAIVRAQIDRKSLPGKPIRAIEEGGGTTCSDIVTVALGENATISSRARSSSTFAATVDSAHVSVESRVMALTIVEAGGERV